MLFKKDSEDRQPLSSQTTFTHLLTTQNGNYKSKENNCTGAHGRDTKEGETETSDVSLISRNGLPIRRTKLSVPRLKLRKMYNSYSDAMRNGSPARRIHARALRRRRLKYRSDKPASLTFESSIKNDQPNKVRFKPLTCPGTTHKKENNDDPDIMYNKMLVQEYLRNTNDSGGEKGLSVKMKVKPVVSQLHPLPQSENIEKSNASFSDWRKKKDKLPSLSHSSETIQLSGFHLASSKLLRGQKRQYMEDTMQAKVPIAKGLELSSASVEIMESPVSSPEGLLKEGVREIQIYIPTVEREETIVAEELDSLDLSSSTDSGMSDKKHHFISNVFDRDKVRPAIRHSSSASNKQKCFLLSKEIPKIRKETRKFLLSPVEIQCRPFDRVRKSKVGARTSNQIEDSLTKTKLPRLKYHTASGYKTQPQIKSSSLPDFRGFNSQRENMVFSDDEYVIRSTGSFKNSNSNNSMGIGNMENVLDLKPDICEDFEMLRVSGKKEPQTSGCLNIPVIRTITATPTFTETQLEKKE